MTLETLKENNAKSGHHWFSPSTMRFFRCRVSERLYRADDGTIYFVTSEQRWDDRRRYTVRVTKDLGVTIDTAGEFQAFSTARAAHARARYLATGK